VLEELGVLERTGRRRRRSARLQRDWLHSLKI
jgi:hypothetical protein